MTSIETNAKQLAQLTKKKVRIEKSLSTVNAEITKAQEVINKQFGKLGLDTNFS